MWPASLVAVSLCPAPPVLLRIDASVLEAVQRWANDDLRSLNAQIEYQLREALRRAGRTPRPAEQVPELDKPGGAPPSGPSGS